MFPLVVNYNVVLIIKSESFEGLLDPCSLLKGHNSTYCWIDVQVEGEGGKLVAC